MIVCQCKHCEKQLSSRQSLLYHVNHNVCRNKFVCERCNMSFSSKQKLNYHTTQNVCIKGEKIKLTIKKNVADLSSYTKEELIQIVTYQKKEIDALKKHPQTITNKKDPFAQISDGHKYIYASKKSIITQLIENKRHILQEYVDNNGDKYGEKILRRYQNYVDFLDDDKEAQKDLEVDIICMLLNVSDVIGSDEWSKKLLEELKVGEP